MNRVLPPFSMQRYLAIWAVATLVLVGVLMVLVWPFGNNSGQAVSGAQPTTAANDFQAGALGGSPVSQTAQPTQMPVAGEPTGTAPVGGSPAGENAAGAGKFLVIDTDKGRIVAKLHTDASANVARTIANFEQKANAGYFDISNFHRVEDWVVQGGDPTGTGTGGNQIPSEYNELPFVTGALGVARTVDRTQMNDSQFFIVKRESPHLNGEYTNWGQVVEGMDVVNALAPGDKMTKVRVENR
ncbi:MAG TPA: peptidylprolyl isomerase [Chloroflexia bacterium]|nr:peptidylprolyl isomerase [Chloroflexia bacterium]